MKQRSILQARFEMETVERERIQSIREEAAKKEAAKIEALQQPKSPEIEAELAARYGAMDLEDRAFNILLDLGMIEESPDPSSPEYDDSRDDEFVS